MIKLLRRMTIIGMVLAMCVSCLTPIAFATSVENSDKNSIIQIEFDEYISSKEYYRSFLEEGKTLIIRLGDKYKDAGLAEFASGNGSNADTVQIKSALTENIVPYGIGIPTKDWNVSLQGTRSILGSDTSTLGYLFTNWNFVGCSAYEADIVNLSNSALSVDFLVKNTSTSPFASFSIPAQSVVAKIVTKPSWYARFKCPCDVSGNVFKYVMH